MQRGGGGGGEGKRRRPEVGKVAAAAAIDTREKRKRERVATSFQVATFFRPPHLARGLSPYSAQKRRWLQASTLFLKKVGKVRATPSCFSFPLPPFASLARGLRKTLNKRLLRAEGGGKAKWGLISHPHTHARTGHIKSKHPSSSSSSFFVLLPHAEGKHKSRGGSSSSLSFFMSWSFAAAAAWFPFLPALFIVGKYAVNILYRRRGGGNGARVEAAAGGK